MRLRVKWEGAKVGSYVKKRPIIKTTLPLKISINAMLFAAQLLSHVLKETNMIRIELILN